MWIWQSAEFEGVPGPPRNGPVPVEGPMKCGNCGAEVVAMNCTYGGEGVFEDTGRPYIPGRD